MAAAMHRFAARSGTAIFRNQRQQLVNTSRHAVLGARVPRRATFITASAPVAASLLQRFKLEPKGVPETLEYRLHMVQEGKQISGWHEIPLYAGKDNVHFICEIPKNTSAKMEVATDEPLTPIKQDVKKGKIRFYPYDIHWNYGLLPQTWEDPEATNKELGGVAGDNDPVDAVEIGSSKLNMGGVYEVKPLGVYAMIDDGELDWKIIVINVDDPKANSLNDIEDVEREFPGELQKIMEWFRDYKIPDGKPANVFGYDFKPLNRQFSLDVIKETHEAYTKLKSGKRQNSEDLSLI